MEGEKIEVYSLIASTDFHPPLCERVVVRDGPSLLQRKDPTGSAASPCVLREASGT